MWYKIGVVCGLLLALLVGSPHADVYCDGVDDLLTQAQTLDTFINATTFTVVAWVASPGSVFATTNCWSSGPFLMDTSEYLAIGRTGTADTGNVCVYAYDGADKLLTWPIWAGGFHMAARLSGGTLTLFVGGYNVTSRTMGAIGDVSAALQLCGGPDGHSPDRIIDVVVYDTALSDETIAAMGASRLHYTPRGSPTAYWPLDDCADGGRGDTVSFKDRSGNNRHLTGNRGGNGDGLLCRATDLLSRPMEIQ